MGEYAESPKQNEVSERQDLEKKLEDAHEQAMKRLVRKQRLLALQMRELEQNQIQPGGFTREQQ